MIRTEYTVTSRNTDWEAYRHPELSDTFIFNREGATDASEDVYFIARKIQYDHLTEREIVDDRLQVVHAQNCGVTRDSAELVEPMTSDLDKIVRLANGTDRSSIAHWIGDDFVELGRVVEEFGREPTIHFISSLLSGVWDEEDAELVFEKLPDTTRIGIKWDTLLGEEYDRADNPTPDHIIIDKGDNHSVTDVLGILGRLENTTACDALRVLEEDIHDYCKLKKFTDVKLIEPEDDINPPRFELASQ